MTGQYDEDLEQEVYIRTWKNLENYKERNHFKAWLNKITYNICRDYLKSSIMKNRNKLEDESLGENVCDKISIETNIDSINKQIKIMEEIDRLPKKYKQVVIYHELEEKTYEEIASILNIPIGTVKSRLHNGKELLKIALKDMLIE
jgi:RNA polymerase sigma-70 factor (ECF subfamily)